MSAGDVAEHKAELRAHARALRSSLPAARREEQSQRIAERLLRLPEAREATGVLAYGANPEEVDPLPAVEALRARGARIAYPRMAGGTLALHWVECLDELGVGALGIREPIESCECADLDRIDLVLVPGLAFGRDMYRLGFGSGYYDRFLPEVPDAVTLGLSFDEQLFDEVPHEEHDVPLDAVVTPTTVLRLD